MPPLPQRSASPIRVIDIGNVVTPDKLDRFANRITCLRRHQQVDMIGHEDIGVDGTSVLLCPLLEPIKIGGIVFFSEKYGLTAIAALDHMGGNTWQIKSWFTWHDDILVSVARLHSIDYWQDKGTDPFNLLLYMNNFDLIEDGQQTIRCDMSVNEAIEAFRLGERVAAGSTHTHRGAKEASFWANPFPLLKELNGEQQRVLHPALFEQFKAIEQRFINVFRQLSERDEMTIGIACSQLMAGVYEGNSDEDLSRCGYLNRDEVEMQAPERLATDLIELIKRHAQKKRQRLGDGVDEISITVALVGDSRTGKSETAEKMEGILNLQLV